MDGIYNHQLKKLQKKLALLPQGVGSDKGISVYELVSYGRYPHQNGLGYLTHQDRAEDRWALEDPNFFPRFPVDDFIRWTETTSLDCHGSCPIPIPFS